MQHEITRNAGQRLTHISSVHKSTYKTTAAEKTENGSGKRRKLDRKYVHCRLTVNFVDCRIASPSLSCRPVGREPSMPFRFATVPPSISGHHQLPRPALVGGGVIIDRTVQAALRAPRSMSADDDHEITCVRSSGDHVTGLDRRRAVIMPQMT